MPRDAIAAALLAEAGLDAKSLDCPTARCPVTYSLRLLKIALAATGDPGFGFNPRTLNRGGERTLTAVFEVI
ncbi:MAG: AraC family transcriptional regulator ligand-binding domain-containing protein [Steroidobacteraceae bacterium]